MFCSTHDSLRERVAAQAANLDEIFAAIDRGDPYDVGSGSEQDPYDARHEAPLEVAVVRRLRVVLATGGPHVEAACDLDDAGAISHARVLGTWGSAQVDYPVDSGNALFRLLEHLAEGAFS